MQKARLGFDHHKGKWEKIKDNNNINQLTRFCIYEKTRMKRALHVLI